MRIGLVSIWCNRGQATVTRHLRSALDELGHQTFVLARPTRAAAGKQPMLATTDVWDQPNVTPASEHAVPLAEYQRWVTSNALDLVFFDQNYQFDCIESLRHQGVRTVGRFVWEQFSDAHLEAALKAYSVIYSMTDCERQRYATWGVDSPRVRYGCHPELLNKRVEQPTDSIKFFFPSAGQRKLEGVTIRAFISGAPATATLVRKGQTARRDVTAAPTDPRIQTIEDDLSFDAYHAVMASCHVCLAPSRWEGLGLHLYEAVAHGLPVVAVDFAPVNEVIQNDVNGILVPAVEDGETKSGLPAWTCDGAELSAAVRRAAEPDELAKLRAGAIASRDQWSWDKTVADLARLLDRAATCP